MIDPKIEELIPLSQAAAVIKEKTGMQPSDESLLLWSLYGRQGAILATIMREGRRFTSHEAIARFVRESRF